MTIKQWIASFIPHFILAILFPKRFPKKIKPHFISIHNPFSSKDFWMFLRQDTWIEQEFLNKGLLGGWEKESLKIWCALSKTANTVIDIGANTGTYALLAQNMNPSARVIAIEPVDINYEILKKNVLENQYPIICEKIALSDKEGTAKMYMLKDQLNYMTSVNDDRYALHPEIQGNAEVVEITVEIKPFSYVVEKNNITNMDLIKLDVEGHELTVLRSMEKYLRNSKPPILIEIIGDDHAIALDTFFRALGYEQYIAVNEKGGSQEVDRLWDNDHANFLICDKATARFLINEGLIQ